MSEELKACPFCGFEAESDEFGGYARCTNLRSAESACFMAFDWISVQHWNTRPAPTEAEVLAAAKRMAAVDYGCDVWSETIEDVRNKYLRMARAALGIEP